MGLWKGAVVVGCCVFIDIDKVDNPIHYNFEITLLVIVFNIINYFISELGKPFFTSLNVDVDRNGRQTYGAHLV